MGSRWMCVVGEFGGDYLSVHSCRNAEQLNIEETSCAFSTVGVSERKIFLSLSFTFFFSSWPTLSGISGDRERERGKGRDKDNEGGEVCEGYLYQVSQGHYLRGLSGLRPHPPPPPGSEQRLLLSTGPLC